MSKLQLLILFLINFTLFANGPESANYEKEEILKAQSKPVIEFKTRRDMIDMLIEDSWSNFSKIKSFAMQNLGGLKSDNEIIIKINDTPFLSNGRDAKLIINVNSLGDKKGEIRSYYLKLTMTYQEIEEYFKDFDPAAYFYTYFDLVVAPVELGTEIGMKDLSELVRLRYSSVKSSFSGSNNVVYYPPFLNIIIRANYSGENLYDVLFFSSALNKSVEIEKVNAEMGNQDFHQNVRRLVQAVKSAKITNPEFAGDEIKKFYPKTVLGDYWGSFPGKRFISKIQLNGTSGSFITGNHDYYGLIRRGDKNNFSSEINNWVNYLSYALGKNYVAVKSYDQFNLLSNVTFIPVNQDFGADPEIVVISLEATKNIFIEDGQEELILQIYTPLFGFYKYEDYWVPMIEMFDFN
jgi:hypothetical protein